MSIYQPYTYLIGWSKLNLWYYGLQYGKKSNPNNLWKTYFTSSKEVAIVRDIYGEPDITQIRHTFDDTNKARIWESKLLKRMKVVGNPKWLNKTDNIIFEIRPQDGDNNPMWKGGKTKLICLECKAKFTSWIHKRRMTYYCSRKCFDKHREKGALNFNKTWLIISPWGHLYLKKNLKQFCEENNISYQNLVNVDKGRRKHSQGWKAFLVSSI